MRRLRGKSCLTLFPGGGLYLDRAEFLGVALSDSYEGIFRTMKRLGGIEEFESRFDDILRYIGNDQLTFMRGRQLGIRPVVYSRKGRWIWNNTDLYDEFGDMLCRGSARELDNALWFYRQTEVQRRKILDEAIKTIRDTSTRIYDRAKVLEVTGVDLPASSLGLGPDYSTLASQAAYGNKFIVYGGNPDFAKIPIKLSGDYANDFKQALRAGNLDNKVLKEEGYTLHHLDAGWNPVTREGIMQLVLREFHINKIYDVFDHVGSVREFQLCFNAGYRSEYRNAQLLLP